MHVQVKAVIFDKTGTLTVGKPVVVSAVLFSSYPMEEFCDLAAAAEVSTIFFHFLLLYSYKRCMVERLRISEFDFRA